MCTRTHLKTMAHFLKSLLQICVINRLQDVFFKSFFLILRLLLSLDAPETVSSFSVRNECFLSAVTFVIVNHLRDMLSEIPAFHNDDRTLHGLGDVSDWFSLTREKL